MAARYSVDRERCIGCGLCHERAPDNIDVPPGELSAAVYKQPDNDDEEEACREAAEYCPTGGLEEVRPVARRARIGDDNGTRRAGDPGQDALEV